MTSKSRKVKWHGAVVHRLLRKGKIMTTTKLVYLGVIFGLAVLFMYFALRKKKRPEEPPKEEWVNIDLKDSNDTRYSLPPEEKTALAKAKKTIVLTSSVTNKICVSNSWFNKIENLVNDAYVIYKNAGAPRFAPSEANFIYFRNLYYRSVKAGKLLEEAESEVGNKVLALHRIRFNDISSIERHQIIELQKNLPQLQSLIAKEKHHVWNNTHRLKLFISRCGRSGSIWYKKHRKYQKIKYGK